MNFGDRLRAARKARGLTQTELGEKCGTIKQTIFKYEKSIVTNIPSDRVEQLAEALDVSPGYLMGWEELAENPTPDKISAAKQALIAMIDDLPDDQVEKLLQIAKTVFEK